MNKNNLIYLDNNSTTRVDPRVFDAMAPYFHELYGNPSSPHRYGLEASIAVEASRLMIKKLFGIEDRELYFTSSATESINIAIMGTAFANFSIKKHLITQATEHPAVLEVFKSLESLGFRTTVLDVDGQGFVDPQAIKNAIEPDTLLVSIMAANNEIGTLQDLVSIGKICEETEVLFHSDLTQAAGRYDFNVSEIKLDMISGGAHKIHGPKGIGYLGLNKTTKKIRINPLMYGGGQENGLSPGTLNVPLIVGLSKALEICEENRTGETEFLNGLRQLFFTTLTENIEGVHLNGPGIRLLNNLSLRFDNISSNDLINGIKTLAFSAGSACATGEGKPSHVLRAIGLNDSQIKSTARFGFSRFNSGHEILTAANEIVNFIKLKRK